MRHFNDSLIIFSSYSIRLRKSDFKWSSIAFSSSEIDFLLFLSASLKLFSDLQSSLRSGFGRFVFIFISGVEVKCQTGSEPGRLCWRETDRFPALFLSNHQNTANHLLTAFLCRARCIVGNPYHWVSCGLVANDDLMCEIFHGLMDCLVQICPENRSAAVQSLNDRVKCERSRFWTLAREQMLTEQTNPWNTSRNNSAFHSCFTESSDFTPQSQTTNCILHKESEACFRRITNAISVNDAQIMLFVQNMPFWFVGWNMTVAFLCEFACVCKWMQRCSRSSCVWLNCSCLWWVHVIVAHVCKLSLELKNQSVIHQKPWDERESVFDMLCVCD